MNELMKDIATDIIKQNSGYRPNNLEALVEKRAKPQLDEFAKEFKEIIKENRRFKSTRDLAPTLLDPGIKFS